MKIGTSVKIVRVARRLLEREGEAEVSMRRIAAEVLVTPMAIYRHFPDREALLRAIADTGFEELRARYRKLDGAAPEKAFEKLADEYLTFALEHPRLFEYMFSSPRPGARKFPGDFVAEKSPTASIVAEHVREAIAAGFLRADDVWEVTMAISAQAHGLIVLYLGGRFQMSEADFRKLYRRCMKRLLHGIHK